MFTIKSRPQRSIKKSSLIFRLSQHEGILAWLSEIYTNTWFGLRYKSAACPLPCSVLTFTVHYRDDIRASTRVHDSINIAFDKEVEVEHIVDAYGPTALLVEVGSALGLWLGLSVVGIFDIVVLVLTKSRQLGKHISSTAKER